MGVGLLTLKSQINLRINMVQAWFLDADSVESNPTLPNKKLVSQDVSIQKLTLLGVLYFRVEGGECSERLNQIRAQREYKNFDLVEIAPGKLPNFDEKVKIFFKEHIHDDEEIRYVLEGSGYFDIRDNFDSWIRIFVEKNDLIILPAGIYHRFTLDTNQYIKVMRLFKDEPKWTPFERSADTDARPARKCFVPLSKSSNGKAVIYNDGAPALAHYPHMRIVNGFVYISGLSSRRPDGSHLGATLKQDGTYDLIIEDQTKGCIENLNTLLSSIGLNLGSIVDCSVFLTDMSNFSGYNSVYNAYFDAENGPTRTTVAVKQLPHPNLLIEIKAVAALSHDK